MLKAKKIGLILDEKVTLTIKNTDGSDLIVNCTVFQADYDRLFLYCNNINEQTQQFLFEGADVLVNLATTENKYSYLSKVIYPPENGLIVVEYYKTNSTYSYTQRKMFRVNTTISIDIMKEDGGFLATETINLSGGGCCIVSNEPFAENSIQQAKIHLTLDVEPIELNLRIVKVLFSEDKKYFLCCEFYNISEKDKSAIIKFCYQKQHHLQ